MALTYEINISKFKGLPSSESTVTIEIDPAQKHIYCPAFGTSFPLSFDTKTGLIGDILYYSDNITTDATSNKTSPISTKTISPRRSKSTSGGGGPGISSDKSSFQSYIFCEESMRDEYQSNLHDSLPGPHDYCCSSPNWKRKPYMYKELQRAVWLYNQQVTSSLPSDVIGVASLSANNSHRTNPAESHRFVKSDCVSTPDLGTYQQESGTLVLNDMQLRSVGCSDDAQFSGVIAGQVTLSPEGKDKIEEPFWPVVATSNSFANCSNDNQAPNSAKKTVLKESKVRKLLPKPSSESGNCRGHKNCGNKRLITAGRQLAPNDMTEKIKRDIALKGIEDMRRSRRTGFKIGPVSLPKTNHSAQSQETPSKSGLRCKICEKTFAKRWNLQAHYRSHLGEKKFQCTICGAKFTRKHSLNYHMTCHSGEVRFSCPWCDKVYRHVGHFKDHVAVHQQNPFVCLQCGNSYSYRNTLKRHVQLAHAPHKPIRLLPGFKESSEAKPKTGPASALPSTATTLPSTVPSSCDQNRQFVLLNAQDSEQPLMVEIHAGDIDSIMREIGASDASLEGR